MVHVPGSRIYGERIPEMSGSDEYLTLHFSPGAAPRKQRWRNYGLSADFLGDYFATFFPGDELTEAQINRRESVKSAVSFIANELLENAVKYSNSKKEYPITITLYLYEQKIIFQVINYSDRPTASRYQTFVETLIESDIDEIYTQHLEKVALGSGESCMGVLTMINDYSATFGWQFQDSPEDLEDVTPSDDGSVLVKVVASLQV